MKQKLLLPVVPHASASVDAVARAAQRLDLDLVFIGDKRTFDSASARAHRPYGRLVLGNLDAPASLLRVLREEDASAITTFSEAMLSPTWKLAGALGLPFHSREVVIRLTNKAVQRRVLSESGVDSVEAITVTDRQALIDAVVASTGPVVIKPVNGAGSRDTHPVWALDDVPNDVRPTPEDPFLVEEMLVGKACAPFGDYLSVESLIVDGAVTTLGVTGKLPLAPPFRETGQFIPAHVSDEEAAGAAELATRALTAIGVSTGLTHTEIKLTERGPRIIEVNGRLGGHIAELYRRGANVDLIEHGLAAACGGGRVAGPVPRPDRVSFIIWTTPPAGGGIVMRTEGVDAAEQVEGVRGIDRSHTAEGMMPPGVTTAMVDLIRGEVADHAALLAARHEVFVCLSYTLVGASAEKSLWRPSELGLLTYATDKEQRKDEE
jgi:biotin carboxylase